MLNFFLPLHFYSLYNPHLKIKTYLSSKGGRCLSVSLCLKKLNEILKMCCIIDNDFKKASEIVELSVKNTKSKYSVEYIEALLEVLNGVNPNGESVIGYYNSSENTIGGYIKI